MTSSEEKLKRAIEGTGFAEVIQTASNEDAEPAPEVKKIVVQLRIHRDDTPKWLSVVDFIIQEEEEQDNEGEKWLAHCCKTYLRYEGKLGFVWSISISSRDNVKRAINDVSRAIRTLTASLKAIPAAESQFANQQRPKNAIKNAAIAVANSGRQPILSAIGSRTEVIEMPLTGVTEDRNKPAGKGSKGAHYISGG